MISENKSNNSSFQDSKSVYLKLVYCASAFTVSSNKPRRVEMRPRRIEMRQQLGQLFSFHYVTKVQGFLHKDEWSTEAAG